MPSDRPSRSTRGSSTANSKKTLSTAGLSESKRPTMRRSHSDHRASVLNPTKLFVLDTNVLIHDFTSICRFDEHDVYIPMMTLEELDNNKKGTSDTARNARQITRVFDKIVQSHPNGIEEGISLESHSGGQATGKLIFQSKSAVFNLPAELPSGKGDNQILGVVLWLEKENPEREVVLVSKDINIRIKARTLGLAAEDYFNDQVVEDTNLLPTGMHELAEDFWAKQPKRIKSRHERGGAIYEVSGPFCKKLAVNEFVSVDKEGFEAKVVQCDSKTATLKQLTDHYTEKNAVGGIVARNREQNFALNLLMDENIDFVTLLGQAGTGKTLLTLAAAVEQAFNRNKFTEILYTRATISMGEDIGALPGTEEEKMAAWCGAMDDSLEVLAKANPSLNKPNAQGQVKSKIKIKSMNFMRGRTFQNKFVVIDECQNLTPKQMKALVTRAGNGTKIVCLGNLQQIDSPYLTEGSSGLAYVVDRFRNWPHAGHLTLTICERSRLADYAGEVL